MHMCTGVLLYLRIHKIVFILLIWIQGEVGGMNAFELVFHNARSRMVYLNFQELN